MAEHKAGGVTAMDARRTKMMMSQYKEFHTRASPHHICIPDKNKMNRWYSLICGLDGPHEFGEYWIMFEAGPEFPQKAPKDFQVYTENGVFEMGGPICLSMGEWHDKDSGRTDIWRPSLGMTGFAENVVNAMICYDSLGGGIRIRAYPVMGSPDPAGVAKFAAEVAKFNANVAKMARRSNKFNFAHNPVLVEMLNEFLTEFPDNPAVKNLLLKRSKLATHGKAPSVPKVIARHPEEKVSAAPRPAIMAASPPRLPTPAPPQRADAAESLDDFINEVLGD